MPDDDTAGGAAEWTTLRGRQRWYQRLSAQDLAETQVTAPDGTTYRVRVSSNAPIVGPSTAAAATGRSGRSVGEFLSVNGALAGNTGWTITVLDVPRRFRSERVLYSQFVGAKAIVPDVTVAIADALTRGDALWD